MFRPRAAILAVLIAVAGSAVSFSADAKFEAWLKQIDAVVNRGPFKPEWKSLENFQVPAWYIDGKFGIFIHWGAYSVPAFGNEWYPRNMYVAGSNEFKHHVQTYGPQSRFGYKDFLPMFKAEQFDAAAWARLFSESGAKYVVPVAEHHDGFPMYDYDFTDWSDVHQFARQFAGLFAVAAHGTVEASAAGTSSRKSDQDEIC